MAPSELAYFSGVEMSKQSWVNCISAIALTALFIVATWMLLRFIVSNLAVSQATRHSYRLTRKNVGTFTGFASTLALLVFAFVKGTGFRTPESLFMWHPISMMAATACVYPAAFDAVTMRFQSKTSLERSRLLAIHACLQAIAAVVLCAGFAAIYLNKPPGKHFLTLHSWVGALAISTCILNALYGVAKSARFIQLPRLQWTDATHRSLGYASFVSLITASKLGFYNKVTLLPNGWSQELASPALSWAVPGGTWAYSVIGGWGVFVMSAALFWVAYFALEESGRSSTDSMKGSRKLISKGSKFD